MNYTAPPFLFRTPGKVNFTVALARLVMNTKLTFRWAVSTSDNQDNNDTDVDFADGDDVESDDLDEYVDDDGDDDLGQWLSTKRWLGMILWRSKPRR